MSRRACRKSHPRWCGDEIGWFGQMIALISLLVAILASPFKSRGRIEAENAALGQQLIILRRKVGARAKLTNTDRWFFVELHRWSSSACRYAFHFHFGPIFQIFNGEVAEERIAIQNFRAGHFGTGVGIGHHQSGVGLARRG